MKSSHEIIKNEVTDHTDKKEYKIFLIHILVHSEGSGTRSYMTNDSSYMVKIFVHFLIYDFAPDPIIIFLYMRKYSSFFYQCMLNIFFINGWICLNLFKEYER
jgi:hypothetical protein